jgi:hypothetical protein
MWRSAESGRFDTDGSRGSAIGARSAERIIQTHKASDEIRPGDKPFTLNNVCTRLNQKWGT